MPRIVSCLIRSYTHELKEDAFNIFEKRNIYLNIKAVEKDSFILEISDVSDTSIDDELFSKKAHAIFNLYLVALNVSTLGLFLNHEAKHLSPEYQFTDTENNRMGRGIVAHNVHDIDLSGRVINSQEILAPQKNLWAVSGTDKAPSA